MKSEEKYSGNFSSNKFCDRFVEYELEGEEANEGIECFNDIYKELCYLIGEQNMKKIYDRFRGVSVEFPQKLYSKEYIRKFIYENRVQMPPKDIAMKFGLTERRIRQIFQEIKKKEGEI